MRTLLGTFSLLPLVATALAQAPAANTTGVVALRLAEPAACPVGFQARHAQQGAVVNVKGSHDHRGQSYQLTFDPHEGRILTQVRITLHGLAGGQVVPAASTSQADATESYQLSFATSGKHVFQSTVYAEKLTGVQWVELNELTYADGTTWHESAGATCRVAPNGFMLVASGQ